MDTMQKYYYKVFPTDQREMFIGANSREMNRFRDCTIKLEGIEEHTAYVLGTILTEDAVSTAIADEQSQLQTMYNHFVCDYTSGLLVDILAAQVQIYETLLQGSQAGPQNMVTMHGFLIDPAASQKIDQGLKGIDYAMFNLDRSFSPALRARNITSKQIISSATPVSHLRELLAPSRALV